MLGARIPPRGLCSSVAGWTDGHRTLPQLLLPHVSSGAQTLHQTRGLELRNHLSKGLWGQLEGAPAPLRTHWDAEGSGTLPGQAGGGRFGCSWNELTCRLADALQDTADLCLLCS